MPLPSQADGPCCVADSHVIVSNPDLMCDHAIHIGYGVLHS